MEDAPSLPGRRSAGPVTPPPAIDPVFLALALDSLADAALAGPKAQGATYAEFRLERLRSQTLVARDRHLHGATARDAAGFSVRVIHNGVWGFAAGVDLTADAAAAVAMRAVETAKVLAVLQNGPVMLADEPTYRASHVSQYEIDPFDVPDDEKIEFLLGLNERARGSVRVDHVTSGLHLVCEQKFFASSAGSRITQQRIRVGGHLSATRVGADMGTFDSMRTVAPPTARGWEYFKAGSALVAEVDELPSLLEEKMASSPVTPGRYDLVIHPTNLWLTLHETVAHATELDRALGYEANYAGTSFATPDQLNTLDVGSPLMNVTGDRQVPHGLATVAYDDEGVAAQTWDIVREGVLVGFQLNREMAHRQGLARSNGCAFADGPGHAPLQRIPNVSLAPSASQTSLDDLIAAVDNGIYVVGDRTWSIDMQRSNFQFTGQRFFRIRHGRLAGQIRDVAYRGKTTAFWGAMEAVGGHCTYAAGGLMNCGKGEPLQSAPATHGCPAALFRGIEVVNTATEAGR